MKVIVTGANGFIGSSLIKKMIDKDISVLAIDISFKINKLPISDKITLFELSVENIEELKQYVQYGDYHIFYHFAWVGSAGPSRTDEKLQISNALNTVESLRVAHDIGCKKFICAGSIMEYEVNQVIYTQGTKPDMAYIYGVGKVLAHGLCKPIANMLGIELIWAYITNAYGIGEKSPRFINTTLRRIINGQQLEFTSATQNYDFVYIDDVANAFYLLGIFGKSNRGYIIGSGFARPLKDFITEMCQANDANNPPLFGKVPYTGVNLPLEFFSTKQIEQDCGYHSTISFAEGTKKTINWLKDVD